MLERGASSVSLFLIDEQRRETPDVNAPSFTDYFILLVRQSLVDVPKEVC